MSHQRILDACFLKSTRAQNTAVALAAGGPLRQRIVAAVCQTVVEAQRDAALDNLSFRHRNQRRPNAELFPFDAGPGSQLSCTLECLDELRPAVGIAGIVERIDT